MKFFIAFLAFVLVFTGSVASQQVVSEIACGSIHSLALKSDGTVWAWGGNYYGQLGNGTSVGNPNPLPIQVLGPTGTGSALSGIVSIAAGYRHSLALKSDGTVWAWGGNFVGQLGNGSSTDSVIPIQVLGPTGTGSTLSGIVSIAAGYDHSLALKSDGTVLTWGKNTWGQLGNGIMGASSNIPVQVLSLSGVTSITGGYNHSLALKSDGTVWAWGYNIYGQLGNGTANNSNVPAQISSLSGIVSIAAGYDHSLALKSDGTVWAWGYNFFGQLGNGSSTDSVIPIQVLGPTGTGSTLSGIVSIAAGSLHSLALKSDGTVWAWGYNIYGQLGNGGTISVPLPTIANITDVVQVRGGEVSTLVLKRDNTLASWGYNGSGQLGNGTTTSSPNPVSVTSFSSPPTPVLLRLSVKRVHGPGNMVPALWTDPTINQWVNEVNTLFTVWGSKIQFQLVGPIEDMLDPHAPVSWYNIPSASYYAAMEDQAEKYPQKFHWRADSVNVYLVSSIADAGGFAGLCSPPIPYGQRDIVVVAPGILGGSVGLAHELGHYLSLLHTHHNHNESYAIGNCPSNSLAGANADFGDFVTDTRNDTDPCSFTSALGLNVAGHDSAFDSFSSAAGYTSAEKANVRSNIMSYHGSLLAGTPTFFQILLGFSQGKFTNGQNLKMWQCLPHRSRVNFGAAGPIIVNASPMSATSPGPSLLTLSGVSLPVTTSGATQVAVRLEDQTSYFVTSSASQTSGAFAEPIYPGVHDAGLLINGDLIAKLPAAIAVRPSLELVTTVVAPDPTFTLTLTTSVPNGQAILFVGGNPLPSPFVISALPYPYFYFDPNALPPYFFVATDGQGVLQLQGTVSLLGALFGLSSGQGITVQCVEASTALLLTNAVNFVLP